MSDKEYKEISCQCGYTQEENPQNFEKYSFEVAKSKIYPEMKFPNMTVWRCKKCMEVSIITRIEKEP